MGYITHEERHPSWRRLFNHERFLICVTVLLVGLAYATYFFRLGRTGDYAGHYRLIQQWDAGVLTMPHFFYHGQVLLLTRFFGWTYSFSSAVVLSLLMMLTSYAVFCYLRSRAPQFPIRGIMLATLILMFWGPANIITIPYSLMTNEMLFDVNLNLGYHLSFSLYNPTSMALLPFALLLYVKVLQAFDDKSHSWKSIVVLALLTLVGTLTKPSFTFAFAPALVLFALWYRRKAPLGIWFWGVIIPTALALVWQFFFWFGNTESGSSIAIAPFQVAVAHSVLMIFASISPYLGIFTTTFLSLLYVFAVAWFYPMLKDRHVQLALLTFVLALAQGWLLMEAGPRWKDGNFLWGARSAQMVLSVAVMAYLLQELSKQNRVLPNRWVSGVYALHSLSGLLWFALYCIFLPGLSNRLW